MATIYEISMQDGSKEKLTLNLGALAELSKKRKDLSDRYFYFYKKIQSKQGLNELEMGEVLYIGYACAHIREDGFEPMSLEDFLWNVTDSREEIGNVFQKLFGVQEKKQNFQKPSRKQHGK